MNRRQRRALLYQQAKRKGPGPTRVLVFCGDHVIDICDPVAARGYQFAPNAEVIRSRKTGEIVEVHVKPHGDDTKLRSRGAGQALTYEEAVADQHIVMLKIWVPGKGFREWNRKDGFNPRRFNPDRLPTTLREMHKL